MSTFSSRKKGKSSSASVGEASRTSVKQEKEEEEKTSTFQQIREICESLAVALFLAFFFKTFEAEAFVIPTGSMAPTLKGRHKDVVCGECGFPFQTSASEEIDADTNRRNGLHVVAGTCPQCGQTQYFGDREPSRKNDEVARSFAGDRILVSKLTFDQRELARWDVSVFRSPPTPRINYIKRIVGLPNENLRVQYGDLFVQKVAPGAESSVDESRTFDEVGDDADSPNVWAPDVDLATTNSSAPIATAGAASEPANFEPFEIARKDYKYLRQMLQVVYDADYSSVKLRELGWPARWRDDLAAKNQGKAGWIETETKKGRVFQFAGAPISVETPQCLALGTDADVSPIAADDAELSWLRYRHIVPSSNDWLFLSVGRLPPDVETAGVVANNPQLIDDFSAYNAGIARRAVWNRSVGRYEWSDDGNDEFYRAAQTVVASDGAQRVVLSKNPAGLGCNWVGDLAVSFALTVEKTASDADKFAIDLVKGGVVFRCSIAPKLGTITLEIPGVAQFDPAQIGFSFQEGKKYEIVFLNVDEEMRVVVDGKELEFPDGGGRYDALTASDANGVAAIPRDRDPNARDLAPVALGVRGSSVRVERLKILRDVYYIAAGRNVENWNSSRFYDLGTARCDRLLERSVSFVGEDDYARFMSSPADWSGYGRTKSALLKQREGQYVAFGDNSGFSSDSRLWTTSASIPHYVDRKYLIGKAFYVYWPHGLPILGTDFPFWPNFEKMRRVD